MKSKVGHWTPITRSISGLPPSKSNISPKKGYISKGNFIFQPIDVNVQWMFVTFPREYHLSFFVASASTKSDSLTPDPHTFRVLRALAFLVRSPWSSHWLELVRPTVFGVDMR